MKEITKATEKDDVHNLTVAVRVRPISDAEIERSCTDIAHAIDVENMVILMDPCDDPDDILRANRSREKQYVFDTAFGPAATQNEVYERTTKELIESVIDGYNATVFAYGPTGAGKTHTMLGVDNDPGIMVRTLNDLFKKMELTSGDSSYKVTMSYLEIYNEMIRDLLNPSSGYLDLREDSKGVVVAGLSEMTASTTKEVMQMLSMGNKQRTCEPTAVNKTSSRSHAVLQVTVKQKSRLRNIVEDVKIGKLFMIDLAGSERAANTQNRGKRLIEGAHINRSLLALGNCINALCEKGIKGPQYINFRDSKLTRLLKDSLGGNCRTVMIAHISPASMCYEESKNTLNYADRAKNIKLKVKRNQYSVNYHIAQYQNIISELRQEILRLKTRLMDNDLKSQQNSATSATFRGCKESKILEKLRTELIESFREQMEIRRQLIDLEDSSMRMANEYTRHTQTIDEWEREKAKRELRLNIEQVAAANSEPVMKPQIIKRKIIYRKNKGDPADINNKDLDTEKDLLRSYDEGWEPADVIEAREELMQISIKEKDNFDQKKELQESLETLRKDRIEIEENLPKRITCDGHRELLKLLCNVHELELKNAELESLAMLKDHLMQQNDLSLQKQEVRQKLCDEIIQLQRAALEDNGVETSPELEVLYQMYQQQLSDSDIAIGYGSTSTVRGGAGGSSQELRPNQFLYGNVPSLTTVMEDGTSHTRPDARKTRKTWIDSVSDMEGDESPPKDYPVNVSQQSNSKISITPLIRQDTSTTFTLDDDPSTAEDTNQSTNKIRKRRMKKRYAQGALSDHEVRYRTTKRNENIFAKATKSDTKLLTNVNKNPVTNRLVRISNSMNDLSVIKTPKNDASSVEDLQTIDDDEDKRPRQRQRSSSLDMGREKLRLRLAIQAAEKQAKKQLLKKQSESNIPIPRMSRKKISMDEISVVTIESKTNMKPSPNPDRDHDSRMMPNIPAQHSIPYTGTPTVRGPTTRRHQQKPHNDKIVAFGGTMNPPSKSTKQVKKTKPGLGIGLGDGLAVSGFSVGTKQIKPGHKRF